MYLRRRQKERHGEPITKGDSDYYARKKRVRAKKAKEAASSRQLSMRSSATPSAGASKLPSLSTQAPPPPRAPPSPISSLDSILTSEDEAVALLINRDSGSGASDEERSVSKGKSAKRKHRVDSSPPPPVGRPGATQSAEVEETKKIRLQSPVPFEDRRPASTTSDRLVALGKIPKRLGAASPLPSFGQPEPGLFGTPAPEQPPWHLAVDTGALISGPMVDTPTSNPPASAGPQSWTTRPTGISAVDAVMEETRMETTPSMADTSNPITNNPSKVPPKPNATNDTSESRAIASLFIQRPKYKQPKRIQTMDDEVVPPRDGRIKRAADPGNAGTAPFALQQTANHPPHALSQSFVSSAAQSSSTLPPGFQLVNPSRPIASASAAQSTSSLPYGFQLKNPSRPAGQASVAQSSSTLPPGVQLPNPTRPVAPPLQPRSWSHLANPSGPLALVSKDASSAQAYGNVHRAPLPQQKAAYHGLAIRPPSRLEPGRLEGGISPVAPLGHSPPM